jgi:DNA-binding MarR family transcriptional regulator
MGKRARDKAHKKERRRIEAAALAESAALARSTWLAQAALTELDGVETSPPGAVGGVGAAGRGDGGVPDPEPPQPAARRKRATKPKPISSDPAIPGDIPGTAPATEGVPHEPGDARRRGRAERRGRATPTADASEALVDATELAARLAGLSTVLQRELSRADADDGLTRARLSALALLVLGGPRTLGALAAAEHVRPPTMTRLVHAMEADGLVAREPHPSDGRSIVIRATPKGEGLLELGRASRIASLARTIEALDGADRRVLEDASDVLAEVLRSSGRASLDASA